MNPGRIPRRTSVMAYDRSHPMARRRHLRKQVLQGRQPSLPPDTIRIHILTRTIPCSLVRHCLPPLRQRSRRPRLSCARPLSALECEASPEDGECRSSWMTLTDRAFDRRLRPRRTANQR